MNLSEIREKYPQYDEVSDLELSQGLYKKFYADKISFGDFAKRIEFDPNTAQPGQEGVYEGLIKPTGKSVVRTGAALVGGMAALPVAGAAGLVKAVSSGSLTEGNKVLEHISSIPSRLLKTEEDEQALATIMKPIEWVQHAAKFYGDSAYELTGSENVGASVATAVEAIAYFATPKLKSKLSKAIRTRKKAAVDATIREIHKERLAKLQKEPQHLKELSAAESRIKYEGTKIGRPLTVREFQGLKTEIPDVGLGKASAAKGVRATDVIKAREIAKRQKRGIEVSTERKQFNQSVESAEKATLAREPESAKVGEPLIRRGPGREKSPQPQSVEDMLTFSFMGTQGAYNAVKANLPRLKNKAIAMGRGIKDWADVEAPFTRIDAPNTGFAFKNIFSMRARYEEFGIESAKTNAKMFGGDASLAPEVVLAAENITKLKNSKPEIKAAATHLKTFFEDAKKEYANRGVDMDFKRRVTRDINDALAVAKKPSDILALNNALKAVDNLNFVHIPTAMWFESTVGNFRDPSAAAKLSLLATQKRKSLTIKSLVDRKLIKKEDIHPADIIASYSRRMGRDFAFLDIAEAAAKDGLAAKSKVAPKEFVDMQHKAPILKGYKVHPMLADKIWEITTMSEGAGMIGNIMNVTKGVAFYNPLFLPMYDTVQGSMLGSFRSLKTPKYIAQGIKDVWTKTPEYWEALENGLASKPFNNPFGSYQEMIASVKVGTKGKVKKALESVLPHKALKNIYNMSWYLAWELDKTVRMTSYRYLKDKGYSSRDAAQIAAKFHGDYASVPAKTRRALNKVFFTPTFKIAMGKLYGQMGIDLAKTIATGGKAGGKSALYGKGLVATFAVVEAWDLFMRSQGFEMDEWGRRYTKEIDTDEGPKDIVITWSNPANMFLKYPYRFADSFLDPTEEKPVVSFLEKNKWEIHPIGRVAYDIANNDNGLGDEIYNKHDPGVTKARKLAWYATKNIVQLLGTMDKQPSTARAQKQFAKETSRLLEYATRPFTFKYMRSQEDRRTYYKVKKLISAFKSDLYQGKGSPERAKVFQEKLNKLIGSVQPGKNEKQ